MASKLFYIAGSLCFLIGTLLSMMEGSHEADMLQHIANAIRESGK